MRDFDHDRQGRVTQTFNGQTRPAGLGPYALQPLETRPISPQAFSALSPAARDRMLLDRQGLLLTTSALDAMQDETFDKTSVRYNGSSYALNDLILAGRAMPDQGKIALTREIINQNIEYVGPEADADWTLGMKRPDAPMRDVIDYAQTLGESLQRKKGDCEDMAIAGAGLLERMGVAPDRLHVMLGTVYGKDGGRQFDHANLAIQDGGGGRGSTVLEVVGHHVAVLPGGAYLQDGLAGQYFVPSVGVRANGAHERFDTAGDKTTPKARFMDPELSENPFSPRLQDMEYKNEAPAVGP